jgi:hypothetical protein
MFNIHGRQMSRIVTHVWQILYEILCDNVQWPTRRQWIAKRRCWRKLPEAVGCIDATSHEILMPSPELQRQHVSGHRHYHCVHTQVVIDNKKKIVHVESGFRRHNNDANTFDMMTPIGDGRTLDFPRNCVLLGDCINPSRHPVVTPFTSAQLRRLPRHERNIRRKIKINKNIRKYRVYVEHVIRLLKVFKIIESLYRHNRDEMGRIVLMCTFVRQKIIITFWFMMYIESAQCI